MSGEPFLPQAPEGIRAVENILTTFAVVSFRMLLWFAMIVLGIVAAMLRSRSPSARDRVGWPRLILRSRRL